MFGIKGKKAAEEVRYRYPGERMAVDGNTAVILCEREASDAAGAYPITPSTQMGEYWAEQAANGHINVSGRPLIFVEPESEHAAAAVTAGLSMTGLRATNFSSSQGIAFMHESLYAAAGKRLPYVLNMGCRAITHASLNVHCAHDDFHCIDDTGFFQLFANSAQEAADLNLIGRRTAELALTPAVVAQDGFLTTHLLEPIRKPERELIAEYLGSPEDLIDSPTPAQRLLFGPTRRRVPALWDVDLPLMSGGVQNQDAFMQTMAAQRPYFHAHVAGLADQAMHEYGALTGRHYQRLSRYRCDDADYLIVGMGSMIVEAQAVADWLRRERQLRVGVVGITLYRPFAGDLLGEVIKGCKGVAVLERTDQPLAEDLPLMREVRATLGKCLENGRTPRGKPLPYPGHAAMTAAEAPDLYSGVYGLGSRDLQPECLIGAVENMLPDSSQRRFFYLGIDFISEPLSPVEAECNDSLLAAYPQVRELAVKGSVNPDLMPPDALTVRIHSIGGWGAITTGKNLAMTLFELLDWEIRANPKYGSEKKGQPTTYYLAAAPTPIRLNCEYRYVDVVMSPDPNVFSHSNPLDGLKPGGVFILQADSPDPDTVWAGIPTARQQEITERGIRLFFVDGFSIARDEASHPELQLRMQGNAFQGAFFAASPLMARASLDEARLFSAIEAQLRRKFGAKGEQVVTDNLRVVRRGFDQTREIRHMPPQAADAPALLPVAPAALAARPRSQSPLGDIHRFWQRTGVHYVAGRGSDRPADPFQALSLLPPVTGLMRDMTQIRFDYPHWQPDKCTACGKCYAVCPDSALPGLVVRPADLLATLIRRIETGGTPTVHLRRVSHRLATLLHAGCHPQGHGGQVGTALDSAICQVLAEQQPGETHDSLERELGRLRSELGDTDFALTAPYWTVREKQCAGSGGLFALTVNPSTCKGCMACISVCKDGALSARPQDETAIAGLRQRWDLWRDLPNTQPEFARIRDLDNGIGALETLLLDKRHYGSMACGDGACLGCGEKTAIHLFTSTVSALMQPRVERQLTRLKDLIVRLEAHMRQQLVAGIDLSDAEALADASLAVPDGDLTLSRLADLLDSGHENTVVDRAWLKDMGQLLARLRDLVWRYESGPSGSGRAAMGAVNSTGCTSVWASSWPYNPYPFPWSSHLFQDSPSMAMGLFEGHMSRMAEGFRAIRQVEDVLSGAPLTAEKAGFYQRFNWRDFSHDEWQLCPPVVAIGGDGAMYDIGFQNLSRALASGTPVKILVLDTQVYSNTGGQACTSGFVGQVSDMSPYGKVGRGKQEIRKEIGLIAMAHRTSFVLQSAVSHLPHLLGGFIDGLNSQRPALFNIYAVCPAEHGVPDDGMDRQSRLAVESRAYPLFRFDPDAGPLIGDGLDLSGNPAPDADWPMTELVGHDDSGQPLRRQKPFTFADFACTEARFGKHFRKIGAADDNGRMLPFAALLALPEAERAGHVPYIEVLQGDGRIGRLAVSDSIVRSADDRLRFWHQLRALSGQAQGSQVQDAVARARQDMARQLSDTLFALAGSAPPPGGQPAAAPAATAATAFEPAWIDPADCTACDDCTRLNGKAFAYGPDGRATVADPSAATYAELVRAAEHCPAACIHPGTPANPDEPGLPALRERASHFA